MEIHDVFGKRKSQCGDDAHSDGIIDIARGTAIIYDSDGEIFHRFFDESDDEKCEDHTHGNAHKMTETDDVCLKPFGVMKCIDPGEILPKIFVKKNGENCRGANEKCVEKETARFMNLASKNLNPEQCRNDSKDGGTGDLENSIHEFCFFVLAP